MTTANNYRQPNTNRFDFPSVAEFGRVCAGDEKISLRDSQGWTGETKAQTLGYAATGNTACVELAEQVLAKIEREADLAVLRPEWFADVAGAYPSVPDYLSGVPENMCRMRRTLNESTPITVWVCTTSSGGVEHADLTRRGVAVLALAIALSNTRPVEIRTFTALQGNAAGDTVVTCKLSQPICLSEAAWALTACAMDRTLAMGIASAHVPGYHGGWSKGINGGCGDSKAQTEVCRRMLNAAPGDVVIPPSTMGAAAIYRDPVGWVIARLQEFKQAMDDAS